MQSNEKRRLIKGVIILSSCLIISPGVLFLVGNILGENVIVYGDMLQLDRPPNSSVSWEVGKMRLIICYGEVVRTSDRFEITRLGGRKMQGINEDPSQTRTETINGKKYRVFEPNSSKRQGLFLIFYYPEGTDLEIWGVGHMQNAETFYTILNSIEWLDEKTPD
jgi:hypothetical protein